MMKTTAEEALAEFDDMERFMEMLADFYKTLEFVGEDPNKIKIKFNVPQLRKIIRFGQRLIRKGEEIR